MLTQTSVSCSVRCCAIWVVLDFAWWSHLISFTHSYQFEWPRPLFWIAKECEQDSKSYSFSFWMWVNRSFSVLINIVSLVFQQINKNLNKNSSVHIIFTTEMYWGVTYCTIFVCMFACLLTGRVTEQAVKFWCCVDFFKLPCWLWICYIPNIYVYIKIK